MFYNIEGVNYDNADMVLENALNVFKIPKGYKNINIEIKTNKNTITEYSIFHGYSILPYFQYSNADRDNRIKNDYSFSFTDIYNINVNLMDDEYYIFAIRIYYGDINIKIKGEHYTQEEKDETEENDDKKGLETYEIVLIVIGSIILFILIIIVIFCVKRKKMVTNEQIEEKMKTLNVLLE